MVKKNCVLFCSQRKIHAGSPTRSSAIAVGESNSEDTATGTQGTDDSETTGCNHDISGTFSPSVSQKEEREQDCTTTRGSQDSSDGYPDHFSSLFVSSNVLCKIELFLYNQGNGE